MSIITKGANGRLIHGWTKEQADQEIEKGVLSQSDVIFLDSTNQIYAFKKFWGSSGGTSEGGENKFLDLTAIFDLGVQQGGNLSDENVAAVRKAFQDHVSTGFISIGLTGYVPMEITKLPESAVSGHETYHIVISTLTVEGSSQMSGYAEYIVAIVCDATSKLYEVTNGAMAFKIDGNGNKYLADDGVYHEINVDTTEITNKLNTLTSDVNTLKTDVANLKTEVNGASAALTELEEASK